MLQKDVLGYLLRNRPHFREIEPERNGAYYSEDFQASQLRQDLKYCLKHSMLRLWLIKKTDAHRIIGYVTFYNIVSYASRGCHLGYRSDQAELEPRLQYGSCDKRH